MWLVAEYEATTLFSLKPATATASGAKTLLVPTPYALKMALLDAACRVDGQTVGEAAWAWLCDLQVAIRPPIEVVVNNTFIKILRPRRDPAKEGSMDAGYFMRTIAYREYAQLADPFGVAFWLSEVADPDALTRWLLAINYLGKRGSFMQCMGLPQQQDTLSDDFLIVGEAAQQMPLESVMTQLDDTATGVPFDRVQIYSGKRISLGKERILHHVILPYRMVSSSRGYTHYRLGGNG